MRGCVEVSKPVVDTTELSVHVAQLDKYGFQHKFITNREGAFVLVRAAVKDDPKVIVTKLDF